MYKRNREKTPTFSVNDVKIEHHTAFFEKLRPSMESVAKRILDAINSGQRIVIKHHNDTDGFCSGLSLDRAIIPLIAKANDKRNATWEKFKRMPSFSPFYNLEDVTKDIAQFLSLEVKFKEEKPLVILTDLGSGPENILPIKQLKLFGCEVIVIDHHPVDPEVDKLVDYHVNPMLIEGAPSEFCAGLICCIISEMINNRVKNTDVISAIACVADHVEEEIRKPYLNAVSDRYSLEDLKLLGKVIDFAVFNLRNLDGKEYIGTLFGDNVERQRALMEILGQELQDRENKIVKQVESLIETAHTEKIQYNIVPVDKLTLRDPYPRLGSIVELIHENKGRTAEKPLVTMGITSNSVTFRAEEATGFHFADVLKEVQEKVPLSFAEGGGHPCAGTFRCSELTFTECLQVVKDYLQRL